MQDQQFVSYDESDYKALKKLYEEHKDTPMEVVTYKGNELLVSYLKYVVEYLSQQFEK